MRAMLNRGSVQGIGIADIAEQVSSATLARIMLAYRGYATRKINGIGALSKAVLSGGRVTLALFTIVFGFPNAKEEI
jgi:hypothetical protein